MTHIDFQPTTCLVRRCSAAAVRDVPAMRTEFGDMVREEDAQQTETCRATKGCGTCPDGHRKGQKEVWTVSTPGASDSVVLASDWAGLGRFWGSGGFSGEEAGSSPISGTCFPCSGGFWPLSVDILCCEGPLRGPFSLPAGGLLASVDRRFVVRYLFMDVHGLGNMTREKSGSDFFSASLFLHWVPSIRFVVFFLHLHRYLRRLLHDAVHFGGCSDVRCRLYFVLHACSLPPRWTTT
jgi:hypothetical protein